MASILQSWVTEFRVNISMYIASAQIGQFQVPRVNNTLCPVPALAEALPGSRLIPDGCDLSGLIEFETVNLPYIDPDRMFSYTVGDEFSICPSFPDCDVANNCSMSSILCPVPRKVPSVTLLDSNGIRVSASWLPVTLSLQPLAGSDYTQVFGTITEQSCCQLSNCLSYPGLCCNCSDQACALCAIPVDGIVSFNGLYGTNAGQYEMYFSGMNLQGSSDREMFWNIISSKYDVDFQLVPVCSDIHSFQC